MLSTVAVSLLGSSVVMPTENLLIHFALTRDVVVEGIPVEIGSGKWVFGSGTGV